jgi:hypothetical protein
MGHTLLNHSSRREITSPIGIGGVDGKEPHIVPLGTDDESEFRLVVGPTDGSSCLSESLQFLPVRQLTIQKGGKESLLNNMSVLSLRNTISEHDNLVGKFTSGLLEHGVMSFSHASEIGNNFPTHQHILKVYQKRTHFLPSWSRIQGMTLFCSPLMEATVTAMEGGMTLDLAGGWVTSAPIMRVSLERNWGMGTW